MAVLHAAGCDSVGYSGVCAYGCSYLVLWWMLRVPYQAAADTTAVVLVVLAERRHGIAHCL